MNRTVPPLPLLAALLLATWCVGMLGRGYWTPDEPREADLSWRMSWQSGKAVPQLAGEAFCEKPPMAYWLAGASMRLFGPEAWAARLPNLLYAAITALSIGWLARRSAGPAAGVAAAAAISTFLLSYQVAIWLATDAPLLAAVSVALLGAYFGFYAVGGRERLRGYLLMHGALGLGFLCKSAAAWMVPALALATLVIVERRWRELWRWELYAGLPLQAAPILIWVWFVYTGPDGPAHLKVFFWNNLVGRFTSVDAPADLQYAAAHRNTPGKYLLELPIYLWPWTLLVVAAARRAWQRRKDAVEQRRAVRFALAALLPALAVLSVAATARNIYLAPALPGAALLLGWWVREIRTSSDLWDVLALRATAVMLLLAALVMAGALAVTEPQSPASTRVLTDSIERNHSTVETPVVTDPIERDHSPVETSVLTDRVDRVDRGDPPAPPGPPWSLAIAGAGLAAAAALAGFAWFAVKTSGGLRAAPPALLLAYGFLLIGPASQIYRRVDAWQDLAALGRAVRGDLAANPLVLFAPDETTRAWVDLYVRRTVTRVEGPIDDAATDRLQLAIAATPGSFALVQLPGRATTPALRSLARRLGLADRAPAETPEPAWLARTRLSVARRYALPNGRRYALLASDRGAGGVPPGGSGAIGQAPEQRLVARDLASP